MSKYTYYNEHDQNAAEWIRQLILLGEIPPGEVDERSIVDVDYESIKSFRQHHFFSGIAVWAYALRQAGWDDDRPVCTGSAPCQSFSAAGLQRGFNDPRHLWPHMFRLIQELRPIAIFGEQVSSKLALQWWDLVAGDLESADYAAAAFDLEAAGCGAPHHRARLFWVAHANSNRNHKNARRDKKANATSEELPPRRPIRTSDDDELGSSSQPQPQKQCESELHDSQQLRSASTSITRSMAHANSDESTRGITSSSSQGDPQVGWNGTATSNSSSSTFWDNAIWLPCRDGKYRPTHPGIPPLASAQSSISAMAHGTTATVGHSSNPSLSKYPTVEEVQSSQEGRTMRLKGYGNAIVAPLATAFIRSAMETIH
jgi:DNA (cytosine-5)-methyltransferase 1